MRHSDDIEQVRSGKVRELHGYWQGKATGQTMPRREDIDPAEIKGLLPDLLLGDFEADPFRVRYRLVGTRLAQIHGIDFTGCYLDQLVFSPDEQLDRAALMRDVFERRVPMFGRGERSLTDGGSVAFELGIFPLSDDGDRPNQWVAVEDYEDLDPLIVERLEKTRLA